MKKKLLFMAMIAILCVCAVITVTQGTNTLAYAYYEQHNYVVSYDKNNFFVLDDNADGDVEYEYPIFDYCESNNCQCDYCVYDYYLNGPDADLTHQIIRGADRQDSDSIVIVLIGDGFETWGEFIYYANTIMNTMKVTRPFYHFDHLFRVHTLFRSTAPGERSYFRTVSSSGYLENRVNFRKRRARRAANAVVSRNNQHIVHVISNAKDFGQAGGCSSIASYNNQVNVSVTTVWKNNPNPTVWQNIFFHKLGHSFGGLDEEYRTPQVTNSGSPFANGDRSPVKWSHWQGHRNVNTRLWQPQFGNSPASPTQNTPASRCMMGTSVGNTSTFTLEFCGVCSAELIRRMAKISGETFHGSSPRTRDDLPNIPNITISARETRILDSAFHGNTNLHTLTIHPLVADIGEYAFIGASGLRVIRNYRAVPQRISPPPRSTPTGFTPDTTFGRISRSQITVYIPRGTRAAFQTAGWTGFRELVEMDAGSYTFMEVGQHNTFNSIYRSGADYFYRYRSLFTCRNAYIAIPNILAFRDILFHNRTITGAFLRFNFSHRDALIEQSGNLRAAVIEATSPSYMYTAPILRSLDVRQTSRTSGIATIDIYAHLRAMELGGRFGIISLWSERESGWPCGYRVNFYNIELILHDALTVTNYRTSDSFHMHQPNQSRTVDGRHIISWDTRIFDVIVYAQEGDYRYGYRNMQLDMGWNSIIFMHRYTGRTTSFTININRVWIDFDCRSDSFVYSLERFYRDRFGELPTHNTNNFEQLPIPTRAGYRFDGWWTARGRQGRQVFSTSVIDNRNSIELFAHWICNNEIYVDFISECDNAIAPIIVHHGSFYRPLPNPRKENHIFLGWYDGWWLGAERITSATMVTERSNHTLYARWQYMPPVTVMFNIESYSTMPIIVRFGRPYGNLPIVFKQGFIFNGWWTCHYGGEEITSCSIVNMPTNHTLYARWIQSPIVISDAHKYINPHAWRDLSDRFDRIYSIWDIWQWFCCGSWHCWCCPINNYYRHKFIEDLAQSTGIIFWVTIEEFNLLQEIRDLTDAWGIEPIMGLIIALEIPISLVNELTQYNPIIDRDHYSKGFNIAYAYLNSLIEMGIIMHSNQNTMFKLAEPAPPADPVIPPSENTIWNIYGQIGFFPIIAPYNYRHNILFLRGMSDVLGVPVRIFTYSYELSYIFSLLKAHNIFLEHWLIVNLYNIITVEDWLALGFFPNFDMYFNHFNQTLDLSTFFFFDYNKEFLLEQMQLTQNLFLIQDKVNFTLYIALYFEKGRMPPFYEWVFDALAKWEELGIEPELFCRWRYCWKYELNYDIIFADWEVYWHMWFGSNDNIFLVEIIVARFYICCCG